MMSENEWTQVFEEKDGGVVFRCRVCPKASKNAVQGLYGDAVKVSVAAPPVDGKANAELVKFLAKRLGRSKSTLSIVSGQTGRDKRLFCAGIKAADAAEKLAK